MGNCECSCEAKYQALPSSDGLMTAGERRQKTIEISRVDVEASTARLETILSRCSGQYITFNLGYEDRRWLKDDPIIRILKHSIKKREPS